MCKRFNNHLIINLSYNARDMVKLNTHYAVQTFWVSAFFSFEELFSKTR